MVYDVLGNYIETASKDHFDSIHFSLEASFLTMLGGMQNINAFL